MIHNAVSELLLLLDDNTRKNMSEETAAILLLDCYGSGLVPEGRLNFWRRRFETAHCCLDFRVRFEHYDLSVAVEDSIEDKCLLRVVFRSDSEGGKRIMALKEMLSSPYRGDWETTRWKPVSDPLVTEFAENFKEIFGNG